MSLSSSLPVDLGDDVLMRLLRRTDAPALADAYRRNREHLAQWEPTRTSAFYTATGQRGSVEGLLDEFASGTTVPFALVQGDEIIGRLTMSGIVHGAFESA